MLLSFNYKNIINSIFYFFFTGYALAIGKFYGESQTYFVSGGPRDGGSGKVKSCKHFGQAINTNPF